MEFAWTKHRFSGGLLALDLANTVVHRDDPARRIDRLAFGQNCKTFIDAALLFRGDELDVDKVCVPENANDSQQLMQLRWCIDDYVRGRLTTGVTSSAAILRLFAAAANAGRGTKAASVGMPFGYYVALSAMRLLDERLIQRCKICPQCGWLFVDKSKNQSRMWCDMAVCGNRVKARAHYKRFGTRKKQSDGEAQ